MEKIKMGKKKKLLIGIGIYLLVCGIIFGVICISRMNRINESYLKEFQESAVLKERFGEIIKVKSSITVKSYDEDKFVVKCKIYTKDNKRYKIYPIYYINNSELFAYLIDDELVYEKDILDN